MNKILVTIAMSCVLASCGGGSSGESVDNNNNNNNDTGGGVNVNSPASFSGDLSITVARTAIENLSGNIIVTDTDAGEATLVEQNTVDTQYGSFSLSSNGDWTYTVNSENSTVSELTDASDTLTETIIITSADESTTNLVVMITGVDPIEGNMGTGAANDSVPDIICTQTVSSLSALEDAAEELVAGDTLCLADGTYSGDLELSIEGAGTAEQPITVAAENSGMAIINNGEISARIGGQYIVLQGFVFRDGTSGSSIIKFEKETECSHCRVTEISIIDMDGGDYDSSKWIEVYGQYNRIDHSWFSGKESRGALLVFPRWIDEDDFDEDTWPTEYAQIDHNYFGDRPPAFGQAYAGSSDNEYEGIRLGLSTTHTASSQTIVEYNYFERIQGEAEVISNKSTDNTIRYNTVRDSNGSIVTRHGSHADISNNFIFGDDNPFSGGIRLVDSDHTVTNNYIEGARYASSNWNGGIVLTTGDGAGRTDNGYQNVENVLVAHNTIVDSVNSINVYGGKNDEAPENIYFVNNIIANAVGAIIRTNDEDMPASSTFDGNYVYGELFSDKDGFTSYSGLTILDAKLAKASDGLYRPSADSPVLTAAVVDTGDFTLPTTDMDGQTRSGTTLSGADEVLATTITRSPLTLNHIGPKNYRPTLGKVYVEKVLVENHDFDSGDLTGWTDNNGAGATIISNEDSFSRGNSLMLDSNAANVSQTVSVMANTNYTLSAFMKGSAKLTVTVDGNLHAAERSSTNYGFSSVSFNTGSATTAVIEATVDDLVLNKTAIENPDFDDGQDGWDVVEGTGIGQVQDSSNSAGGADGSIKLTWNVGDDTGTPHQPYIAQTVTVEANKDYELSIYNLMKDSGDSTILFGAFSEDSATNITSATVIAQKDSNYDTLKNGGSTKGDDSFYEDTLTFNSGSNTSLTIFAQFKSTDGADIRVDQFEMSYQGTPSEGTEAFFDSIRLVSHPLSPAESEAAAGD
jgi:poly(beta-D-mannuronate) lyase